jgi:UPF0755 protein
MDQNQGKTSIALLVISLVFILGLALGLVAWFWWQNNLQAINLQDKILQSIVIPSNASAGDIATLLQKEGLIKNSLVFRLYIKDKGWDKDLKPGRYQFSKAQSMVQIVDLLKSGVTQDFWVTIPEGKRREEIAKILADKFASENLNFSMPDFLEDSKNIEGYLFPDTYLIARTMTASDVVKLMRKTFDQKINDELKVKASNQGLSFQEVLITASMVEREAKFAVDRPKIAGVILNRFKIGMALQVDATIQYALGQQKCGDKIGQVCNWWPQVTDTKLKSKYNTYLNNGLPPAPICNPGLSVIQAVLNPDKHNYLYYLAEPSGVTHYAKTNSEHERNIEKYLQ